MNIQRIAAWLISIALALTLIVVGREFFIPLFLALFIWYIVNGINDRFLALPLVSRYCPPWLTLTLSFSIIGMVLYFVGNLIVANINEFIATAPNYMGKIDGLLLQIHELLGSEGDPWTIDTIKYGDHLVTYSSVLLGGITSIAKGFFLVLLYVIFLLIEQGAFHHKIQAMGLTPSQTERYNTIISQVNYSMRRYLGVKTFTSALTAILSWIVFYAISLDYAVFWAFLIFLFNFVPTIGSITATILPALLALLQFEGISEFLIIGIGVSAIQVVVGNIIEPRMMGDTLNISPLVIVLSLIIWAILWGVVGMLLSVPITVMIIIFCAQFPATRNVAILLSKDGRIGELD